MFDKVIKVRPDKAQYFSALALLISTRSTCIRRKVGCILVDKNGFVLSTGYNGSPPNNPHCIENFKCKREGTQSGSDLDLCEAIHAEQNALLQCKDTMVIKDCFVTATPCIHCLKLLMNTSCENIYYIIPYPNNKASGFMHVKWQESGIGRTMSIVEGVKVNFQWRGMPHDS